RNHERARHQGARSALDATERFVPDHEGLGTLRRRAVLPARDVTVRAVDADADDIDEDLAATCLRLGGPAHRAPPLLAGNHGERAIDADRRQARSGREFRRGFTLRRGERVLVVDDILTTGGSLLETIDAVREGGGDVIGVAVLVDRSDGFAPGIPMLALWRLE